MNKISLIVQREYLTRVRKKSFIILTLLLPLLYLGLVFGMGALAKESLTKTNIAVIDKSGFFTDSVLHKLSNNLNQFTLSTLNEETLKKDYKKNGFNAYAIIPNFDWQKGTEVTVVSQEAKGGITNETIEAAINGAWKDIVQEKLGIDAAKKTIITASKIGVTVQPESDPKSDGKIASNVSRIIGILFYFLLLIYGSGVMMSVMEEKTNRVAEVVVSSVKPFQLMMGKIIGVGLVALTQFVLWVVLIMVIYNVTKASGVGASAASGAIAEIQDVFSKINFGFIILFFILYFIGGFFFYASLYAAIGSAVSEDIKEAQQISFPVTMLVILSLFASQISANDPNSSISFWGSMLPFSSPFVMMSRIPYGVPTGVPWWQIILSLVILYASIIAVAWLSGRIYRTGILMYGKKPSFKEMLKWVKRK